MALQPYVVDTFAERFPRPLATLQRRYGGGGRHYHNWDHIRALLAHAASVRDSLADPGAVELAIYFHDAVYNPLSRQNETKSAALARRVLATQVPTPQVDRVVTLILATAGHTLPPDVDEATKRDASFFLDMDLSILGAGEETYDHYELQIRKEYWMVPRPLFRRARCTVLQGFLGRDRLYFTDYFYAKWEATARANLRRAVASLSGEPAAG